MRRQLKDALHAVHHGGNVHGDMTQDCRKRIAGKQVSQTEHSTAENRQQHMQAVELWIAQVIGGDYQQADC